MVCGSGKRNKERSENAEILKTTFAERLCALRRRKQLTQLELARQLQITQESICHYESDKDKPGYFTLTKLAQALDVTTDYLLGLTERETPPSEFGELRDLQELELIENFRSLCPAAKQRTVAYAQGAKDNQST